MKKSDQNVLSVGTLPKQVYESSSEEWQKQQLTSMSDLYYNYVHKRFVKFRLTH